MKKIILGLMLMSTVTFADMYKTTRVYRGADNNLQEKINSMLDDGWRVVEMCASDSKVIVYYEKPNYSLQGI